MDIRSSLPMPASVSTPLLHLRVIVVFVVTKILQVPVVHGDSVLSTWSVDKTVHQTHAPRDETAAAGMASTLAKKTPTIKFSMKSNSCS